MRVYYSIFLISLLNGICTIMIKIIPFVESAYRIDETITNKRIRQIELLKRT